MAQKDWPGGYIRPVPVDPAGPYQDGAAPGVWTLDQVAYWLKQGLWPLAGNAAPVGLFAGGKAASAQSNVINKVIIPTTGNATDFGDLTVYNYFQLGAGFGSNTRGVFGSIGDSDGANWSNAIQYSTFATSGNSVDFGDLTQARSGAGGASNYVRGIFMAGYSGGGNNTMDYITIASTGDAVDFGDAATFSWGGAGCASSTRALMGGGFDAAALNVIQYVTIASTGNTTDFGDLTAARFYFGALASSTRGVWGGGADPSNVIDYVTIASVGNATDFGDLTVARSVAGAASSTRGVFGGGSTDAASNVMDYITIATTGNATDFGDLTVAVQNMMACSSAAESQQPPATPSGDIAFFSGGSIGGNFGGVTEYINIATTGNGTWFTSLVPSASDTTACGSSTRALIFGGVITGGTTINTISYLTFASIGDAQDFGDLTTPSRYAETLSNSTRGVTATGYTGSANVNTIEYVTIASAGNAQDFGDLSGAFNRGAACASTTRGVFGFGFDPNTANINIIEYVTIASAGNTTDFGDFTWPNDSNNFAGCSNSTRGLFAGGDDSNGGGSGKVNIIHYITIASTGNSTDFGDLTESKSFLAAAASSTRATFAGGSETSGVNSNVIEYVTIASTGNATDFGDLVAGRNDLAGCSNCHGGI